MFSAGPTPRTSLATWDFTVYGLGASQARWTWEQFQALPPEMVEATATLLVELGHDPGLVKTERFGPTGGSA